MVDDERNALLVSSKSFEDSAHECQRQQTDLNAQIETEKEKNNELIKRINKTSKNSASNLQKQAGEKSALLTELGEEKIKYHQSMEELNDLKVALNRMGIDVS